MHWKNEMKISSVFNAIVLITIIFTFCWIGCRPRINEEDVLARVGDVVLTREDMTKWLTWEGVSSDEEKAFVDRWVDRELLYQEAKRLGLHRTEELQWELRQTEREYLIQKLLERTFAQRIQIPDEEIVSYYDKNKTDFQVMEDEVRLFHILTQSLNTANLIYQELQAGKPFQDVAKERSEGLFRDQGGDMGYITKEDVIPEISRVAFRLSEGNIARPFKSEHGYHIIKVLKKRSAGEFRDINEVRDEILQRLRVNKEGNVYYDLLYQLQNKTKYYVYQPEEEAPLSDTLKINITDQQGEESVEE